MLSSVTKRIRHRDSRKRLQISHNVLNLPMIARDTVGNMTSTMTYTFLGDGTGDYILEENDYLPFGTRMPLKTQTTNRYRYAGKEEQNIAGMDLGLLDFGARYYDAYTCRWNAIDPMAHKYFGMSPYNYCGNDPVNMVDSDGREIITSFWVKQPNSFDSKYRKPASDKVNSNRDSGTDLYNNDCKVVDGNKEMVRTLKTEAHDYDNILTFAAHGVADGNGNSVDKITISTDGGSGKHRDVNYVAKYLNENSSVVKNAKEKGSFAVIFLVSCLTAQNGQDSIASQLSIELESVVIAPTETCHVKGDVDKNGKWIVFYKGKVYDTVNGDENSIHQYLSNLDSNLH